MVLINLYDNLSYKISVIKIFYTDKPNRIGKVGAKINHLRIFNIFQKNIPKKGGIFLLLSNKSIKLVIIIKNSS